MGAYLQITPALKTRLGYGEVRGCYSRSRRTPRPSPRDRRRRRRVQCDLDLFNAEKDPSLTRRALHHRPLLRADRASLRGPHAHDVGDQPHPRARRPPRPHHSEHRLPARHRRPAPGLPTGLVPLLHPPSRRGTSTPATTANTPRARSPSFSKTPASKSRCSKPAPSSTAPPRLGWVRICSNATSSPSRTRGDGIYAVGRKSGPVRDRYPAWLYS